MTDRRLLDVLTEALADGEHSADATTLAALHQEVFLTAIIQDALEADYTDTEIVALVTELTEGRSTCIRSVTGSTDAPQYGWLISPVAACAAVTTPVPTSTLATWRAHHRREGAR